MSLVPLFSLKVVRPPCAEIARANARGVFPSLRPHDNLGVAVARRKTLCGALEIGCIDAGGHAIADAQVRSFHKTVRGACFDALEPAVETFERAICAALVGGGLAHALPQRERLLRDGRSRRGTVTRIPRDCDIEAEPSLVCDRDRIPSRRLADHAPVRRGQRRAMPCTLARRRLFLDRAHDGHPHPRDRLRRRGDECGERTLRVDRAAPHKLVALDPHRNLAGHGVDVSQQDHVDGTVADLTYGVAGIVDVRAKAALGHACDEPLDGLALAAGNARDLDEAADEVEVSFARPHPSAFAEAARTRSISRSVMTSGGRYRTTVGPAPSASTPSSWSVRMAPDAFSLSSTPTRSPSPRTSRTRSLGIARSPAMSCAPLSRALWARPSRWISPIAATEAAQASGFPPKVVECERLARSPIFRENAIAPMGIPPAIDFARQRMSGASPYCSIAKSVPVRPNPVWTSSTMRSAPRSAQTRAASCANSRVAGRTPPSPWTSSKMNAAVRSVIAASRASGLLNGTCEKSGTSGPNRSRYSGPHVADNAPIVL